MPPILYLRLGHTDVLLFNTVIPLLLDLSRGLATPSSSSKSTGVRDNVSSVSATPNKVDDSGFKSANESLFDVNSGTYKF